MGKYSKYGIQTRAVHSGQGIDAETGSIRRGIVVANSFKLPEGPVDWSGSEGTVYTRNGAPNERWLEEKLVDLHEAEDCVVLASGVAALHALFFTVLKSGDHIIISDNTYMAVYRQFTDLFNKKYGVEVSFVDSSDLENVKAAVKPNTAWIHTETPANPTTKLTDIAGIAEIAHSAGVGLSVDNTFASPTDQLPLQLGADVVIESLTKFINGHGDSLGGAVLGSHELLEKLRYDAQVNAGGCISPFAAWLIMRGASTLPLRMEYMNKNALRVSEFLESYPGTRFVWYPGLPSHPQHELAKKQMRGGFGGIVAFDVKGTREQHVDLVHKLHVITNAVSLGDDKSLIFYIDDEDERKQFYPEPHKGGFYRFAIGLENTEDLIADLEQAFKAVGI